MYTKYSTGEYTASVRATGASAADAFANILGDKAKLTGSPRVVEGSLEVRVNLTMGAGMHKWLRVVFNQIDVLELCTFKIVDLTSML